MYIEELKRELTGRHLDIWRGHDDTGRPISMAADRQEEYRRRWREEAARPVPPPPPPSGKAHHLHLRHHLSPGDVVAMTAAVESLHRKYPGEYTTSVETTAQEIWQANPRIVAKPSGKVQEVHMQYPAINECGNRAVHFTGAFCEYLGQQIGRPVPLLTNRPHLYLDRHEEMLLAEVRDIGPYVVINAGRKNDFTAKFAGSWLWQEVVDRIGKRVAVVQVGERNPSHHHPPLKGVVNLIGKTTTRQLFRLVRFARAAAGPVTFLMHTSAAFNVPYVCLAGGREEPAWEAYNSTIYLHTMGQLDCCREKACWRSRTVPLGDGDSKDKGSLCVLPVVQPDGEKVPRCLQMIGPERVALALEQVLDGQGPVIPRQARENHHFKDQRVVIHPQPGAAVVLPPGGPPTRLPVSIPSSFRAV